MKKNIFIKDPLLGKSVSRYLKQQNLKGMTKLLSALETYFHKKIYSSVRVDLHEASPVCSYTIFPIEGDKGMNFRLTIENGYITTMTGADIEEGSLEDLAESFFVTLLKDGVKIGFETYLLFYLKNANVASDKKSLVSGRRQSCQVSFKLMYVSNKEPLIHDISAKRFKWACTDKKVLS